MWDTDKAKAGSLGWYIISPAFYLVTIYVVVATIDTDRDQILGLGHLSHVANAFCADPFFRVSLSAGELVIWTQELSIFRFRDGLYLPPRSASQVG
jgi:hypothetical protein